MTIFTGSTKELVLDFAQWMTITTVVGKVVAGFSRIIDLFKTNLLSALAIVQPNLLSALVAVQLVTIIIWHLILFLISLFNYDPILLAKAHFKSISIFI